MSPLKGQNLSPTNFQVARDNSAVISPNRLDDRFKKIGELTLPGQLNSRRVQKGKMFENTAGLIT